MKRETNSRLISCSTIDGKVCASVKPDISIRSFNKNDHEKLEEICLSIMDENLSAYLETLPHWLFSVLVIDLSVNNRMTDAPVFQTSETTLRISSIFNPVVWTILYIRILTLVIIILAMFRKTMMPQMSVITVLVIIIIYELLALIIIYVLWVSMSVVFIQILIRFC